MSRAAGFAEARLPNEIRGKRAPGLAGLAGARLPSTEERQRSTLSHERLYARERGRARSVARAFGVSAVARFARVQGGSVRQGGRRTANR